MRLCCACVNPAGGRLRRFRAPPTRPLRCRRSACRMATTSWPCTRSGFNCVMATYAQRRGPRAAPSEFPVAVAARRRSLAGRLPRRCGRVADDDASTRTDVGVNGSALGTLDAAGRCRSRSSTRSTAPPTAPPPASSESVEGTGQLRRRQRHRVLRHESVESDQGSITIGARARRSGLGTRGSGLGAGRLTFGEPARRQLLISWIVTFP